MFTWKNIARVMTTFATAFTFGAHAQEAANQNTINSQELKPANTTPGQDVDELITNKKMRAESGSKSRWSLSSELSYDGGSLEKPLAEDRPNIAGATGTTTKALLGGSVSTKYNINTRDSLSAGVGVRWIAPLTTDKPKNYNGDRVDAQNPFITYQHFYKWSGIQSVFQLQPQAYTNSNQTNLGYVAALTAAQNNIYELGQSGVSLGLYLFAQGNAYNKTGSIGTPGSEDYIADVRTEQSDYLFGASPFVEYVINDRFNLRTVFNAFNFQHLRSEARNTTFDQNTWTQSFGLGISITRDVFLYPNVQFVPDFARNDRTNVGLLANVNVF